MSIIQFMKRFIWPLAGRVLLVVSALWIVQSLLYSYQGVLFRDLIDNITMSSEASGKLMHYTIILLSTIAIVVALDYISNLILEKKRYHTLAELRSTMLEKLMTSDGVDEVRLGSMMTRLLSDLEFVVNNIISTIPSIASHLSGIIANAITMWIVSRRLTFIAIPFLFLNIVAYLWYTKKVPKARGHERRLYDSMAEGMRSIIEGINVIRSFHVERSYHIFFKDMVRKWKEEAVRIVKYERIYWVLNKIAVGLGPIVTLVIGIYLVYKGLTTIGAVVAVVMLSSPLYGSMMWFLSKFSTLSQLPPVIMRLNDVLQGTKKAHDADSNIKLKEIYIDNISYSVHGRRILNSITLRIRRGEKIAIIGSSESGKSTLARIIAGLIKPTEGCIFINGKRLNNEDKVLKGRVILVTNTDTIIPGSILENITLRRKISEEKLRLVLKAVKLDYSKYSNGLKTIVDRNGESLPEFDRRKIIIARALLSKPDVLILDSILSTFDAETELKILNGITSYLKDSTIIAIGVRPLALMSMNRVIVLHGGKLVMNDRPEALISDDEFKHVFRRIYGVDPTIKMK
ncbi:MAG: hypothetical protein DRJ66_01660 [Thermoprotei archaeon]|nr:MAG: hypothetical protein DRJ66_01660 [Thermoprotei archaeon]